MLKHRTLHVTINSQCSVKSNSQRNTCSYQVYSMNLDNDNFAMLFLFVNLFIFRSLQEFCLSKEYIEMKQRSMV